MARAVRTEWFGKRVSVLTVNGKTVTGTLSEVTDVYVVIENDGAETQVMVHAIIAVALAREAEGTQE